MTEMWLYKLRPLSPFHFGERGVMDSTGAVFHSDSFFGALASGIRMCEGAGVLEELLSEFHRRPPFKVSSLFPYAGEVLFFPLPRHSLPLEREGESDLCLQNLRFVSRGILETMLRRGALDQHLCRDNLCQKGTVWLTSDERGSLPFVSRRGEFWRRHVASRLCVDRTVAASRPHHTTLISFSPDCGFYLLLEVGNATSRSRVENALDYLSEAGLGGNRSAGQGRFSVDFAAPYVPFWPTAGKMFITLSLYHPTLEELDGGVLAEGAAYELGRRDGWAGSPERPGQRRRSTWFIGEGSVLRSTGKESYGELVDVTPVSGPGEHSVYRYGYAFPIGVQGQGMSNEP